MSQIRSTPADLQVRPLVRGMGVIGALFLTLSAETPASSVFVIIPGVIAAAGSGALISMLIAGVVALCMALTYAELGSTFPSAGGEYAIVGQVLGPVAGFATLGVNLFNLLLSCAVLSLGVADYLSAVFPESAPRTTALVALVLATALGVLNIRSSAAVTGAFLLVELVALGLVTVLGASHPMRPLTAMLAHPVGLGANGALTTVGLGGVATGVVVGLFAYDGYGNAVYLAEEVRDVRRRLAHAVLWALTITAVTEMAALAAVLTGAPDLQSLFSAGASMISQFTSQTGGVLFGKIVSAGVALAILNAVIALVLMTGRQIYATARDGVWPAAAARPLVRVHQRFGSPWVATAVAGLLSAGLCFLPMRMLLLLSGSGVTLIYLLLTAACLLHGRRRRAAAPGWRLPLWPAPPLMALVLILVFAASSMKEAAVSFVSSLACAAAAAFYYLVALKRRGCWHLRGPSIGAP
ncbi:MAG TPA: APC family permease [Chthoniobacterales bacterium]